MADFLTVKKEPGRRDPEAAIRELDRYNRLKSARDSVFTPAWQTLSQYFLPNMSDINNDKTEGTSGWSDRIYDTTAIEDARTCTTGQSNWATPAAEPWFQLSPPKSLNMEDDDDGAIWCGICTEIMLDSLARSNYYAASGMQYKNRTVFGTGHLHIEEGRNTLINCTARKIGTYCIANNDEGIADTVYAEFKLSARAAVQEFGVENLGPKVRKAYEGNNGKNMDHEFLFLHVIRPRSDLERQPGKLDPENKPIACFYISFDDKCCVKVSGYDEMPDSITRFDDWGTGAPWGYSPAFETLPNVRQLNYIVRFRDAMSELQANPRILEPVGLSGQLDLRPGGRTTYDPNIPNGKPEEWMSKASLNTTDDAIQKKQDAVHRMFYTDVFSMLSQIDRRMTAYEISQRIGEKLEQLSPMFGRLITEKTGPDLRRIFGIHFRAGKFPPPPRSMYVPDATGTKVRLAMPEVTYTSRLSLALKSLQNRAAVNTMQFVVETAVKTGKLDILDNWDMDAMMRNYAIAEGMSARFERPYREVVQLREARAKQQAQANALAAAEQASKAAKNLGGAPEALQQSVADQIPGAAA